MFLSIIHIFFLELTSKYHFSLTNVPFFRSYTKSYSIIQNPLDRPYLFGYHMLDYTKVQPGRILVSAPLFTTNRIQSPVTNKIIPIGQIFQCDLTNQKCEPLPVPNMVMMSTGDMPLYGYHMILDSQNALLISSPLIYDQASSGRQKIWKTVDLQSYDNISVNYSYPCSLGSQMILAEDKIVLSQETHQSKCPIIAILDRNYNLIYKGGIDGIMFGGVSAVRNDKNEQILCVPTMSTTMIQPQINILHATSDGPSPIVIKVKYGNRHMFNSFGYSTITMDCNNDGYDDFIVSDPSYSPNIINCGAVFIFITNPSNKANSLKVTDGTPSQVLMGNMQEYAYFGTSMKPIGDVNGDGFKDLLVCAPGDNSGIGACYLYLGNGTGFSPNFAQEVKATGPTSVGPIEGFGMSILVGKFNSDGLTDLIISASSPNIIFLFPGNSVCFIRFAKKEEYLSLVTSTSSESDATLSRYNFIFTLSMKCNVDPNLAFTGSPSVKLTISLLNNAGKEIYLSKTFSTSISAVIPLSLVGDTDTAKFEVFLPNPKYFPKSPIVIGIDGTTESSTLPCNDCPEMVIISFAESFYFDVECRNMLLCVPDFSIRTEGNIPENLYGSYSNSMETRFVIDNLGEYANEFFLTIITCFKCEIYISTIPILPTGFLKIKQNHLLTTTEYLIGPFYNFPKSSTITITCQWTIETNLKFAELSANVMCQDEKNLENNVWNTRIPVIFQSELKITGSATVSTLTLIKNKQENTYSKMTDTSYNFELQNRGPSIIGGIQLTITAPLVYNGKLVMKVTSITGDVTCNIPNPQCEDENCLASISKIICHIPTFPVKKLYMYMSIELLNDLTDMLLVEGKDLELKLSAKIEAPNQDTMITQKSELETDISIIVKAKLREEATEVSWWIILLSTLAGLILCLIVVSLLYRFGVAAKMRYKHSDDQQEITETSKNKTDSLSGV